MRRACKRGGQGQVALLVAQCKEGSMTDPEETALPCRAEFEAWSAARRAVDEHMPVGNPHPLLPSTSLSPFVITAEWRNELYELDAAEAEARTELDACLDRVGNRPT